MYLAPEIQPNYRDFSRVPEEELEAANVMHMGNVQPPFPIKLHHMLKEIQKEGNDIASWEFHGR